MAKLALVTGATGFLGSHMVELLVKEGYQVRATDLPLPNQEDDPKRGRYPGLLKKLGVEFIPSNLAKPDNLSEVVKGVDYVFHIAALFSYIIPWEALYQVNVEGTRNLIHALLKEGSVKRFVLWGAGGIYGAPKPEELPIRETSPKQPPNNYLKSKWEQERLVEHFAQKEKLPYTCVRPTGVYGPRAVYGMGQLLCQFGNMKKIKVPKNFTGRMALVHAEDVCRAALFLATRDDALGEAYNLADDVPYTTVEFFKILADLLGKPFKPMPAVPIKLLKGAALTAAVVENFFSQKLLKKKPKLEKDTIFFLGTDFWYSNEKLEKLGFRFAYPDGRAGFAQTIPWYREAGLI
ncbi:MAG: NAD(P)-dependent oxidoreductase [bacterium]